jgi:predicted small metal-binding protein
MKVIRCRDAGFDCDGVIRADTEEELLQQAADHAQTDHNVTVTPEMAEQLRTLIQDETTA